MSTAVYALIGTVLGGAIAALTTWRVEVRREKTQAAAAELLLAIELRNALEATWEIRFDGRWPMGWKREWSATWRATQGPLLTRPPHRNTVGRIASACARLDQLEHAVNDGGLAAQPLTDKNKLFLWKMQQLLAAACNALPDTATEPFEKLPRDPTAKEVREWSVP